MTALVLPRFNIPRVDPFDVATRDVLDRLEQARDQARLEARLVPLDIAGLGAGFDEGIVLEADSEAIVFRPHGGSSGGVLRLADETRRRVIEVDWLTGSITVGDG